MEDEVRIGELRHPVYLARRTQMVSQDLSDPTLIDVLSDRKLVYAKITPVGTQVFLAGIQTEVNRITHRIVIRWQPTLDNYHVILRTTTIGDGTRREDVFRIQRMEQWEGRNRFLIIEAELETRQDGLMP